MERMMGLSEPVDFIEDRDLSWGARLRQFPAMLALGARMLWRFAHLDRKGDDFQAYFAQTYATFDRVHLHELDLSQLLAELRRADQELLQHWETPIVNDFYVMIFNGRVARRLQAAGLPPDLQNRLLAGEPGIESTAPTHFLMDLAAQVRADAALRAAWEAYTDAQLHRLLARDFPAFHASCQTYLDRYGDRCMGELKLESVSLRQDPSFMYAMIRAYLPRPELTADHLGAREQVMRQEAEAEARAALSRRGWRQLRRDLRRWRAGVRQRENMRLARTRVFGLHRDLYLEIGRQLAKAGVLNM
ncbi:MAG: phosphoenolpyruvate synthase, partial [Bacteroidetes bacterium]